MLAEIKVFFAPRTVISEKTPKNSSKCSHEQMGSKAAPELSTTEKVKILAYCSKLKV